MACKALGRLRAEREAAAVITLKGDQDLRVFLCTYNPARTPQGKGYTSRTELTDYPQYDFDNTLNNTTDFQPHCFIEVEVICRRK